MLRKYKQNGTFSFKVQKIQLGEQEEYKTWIHSETEDVLSSYSRDRDVSRYNFFTSLLESFGIRRAT